MASSGTYGYNPTIYQMIVQALYQIGLVPEDGTPTNDQFQKAMTVANNLAKGWQATGQYHVWTEEEAILFLQPLQYRYLLGGNTTDHACDAFNYVLPTLAASAASGATTIRLSSVTGVADTNIIGIFLDDNSIFWTTVSGTPAGVVVTLADALPSMASLGNMVACYPTSAIIGRPLQVPKARSYRFNGGNEVPIFEMARQQYMDLPDKAIPGSPVNWFYSPKLVSGELFLYQPIQQSNVWALRFTWYRGIQDFLVASNTMDLPQEWANALTWNIAMEMGPGAGTPLPKMQLIIAAATSWLQTLEGWDREMQNVQFGIDGRTAQLRG